jgi:hypothetical protein
LISVKLCRQQENLSELSFDLRQDFEDALTAMSLVTHVAPRA